MVPRVAGAKIFRRWAARLDKIKDLLHRACAFPEDIIFFLPEGPSFPGDFKPCDYTELQHFETYFGQFINTIGLAGLWKFAQRKGSGQSLKLTVNVLTVNTKIG